MANSQEKMQQDYIWIRDSSNSDSDVKLRTFG